jgi:hypothetical protein
MKSTASPTQSDLPPYLRATEPMEVEDLPLQVSLLTMEVAEQRKSLASLADMLRLMAAAIEPAAMAAINGD